MSNNPELKVLIPEDQISEKVREIARNISDDFPEGDLLLVALMKGAVIFLADLVREIDVPVRFELIRVRSYENEKTPQHVPVVEDHILESIENKDVIIVDDIYDTGNSIKATLDYIRKFNPRSLKTCFMLEKKMKHIIDMDVDYLGFEVPDEFVVGYGLDLAEAYRDLPYIAVIKK